MRRSRRALRDADVVLYHVGNNAAAHRWIVEELKRRPGVVMLHEVVLHDLVAGLTLARGDTDGYLASVERDGGTLARLFAEGSLAGFLPPLWDFRPDKVPLVSVVCDYATSIIVHSRYAERGLRNAGYTARVWRIPHPAWRPPEAVEALPLVGSPIVLALGEVTWAKRLPRLLTAFARLHARFPRAKLVFAGSGADRLGLAPRLERLGLRRGREVVELGYVSEKRLWAALARADMCVSLRWPTLGETSGSVMRALSFGRPLVVTDVGWYSELPDRVAAKVPVDEMEVDMLAAVLTLLAEHPELREQMGAFASEYAKNEHDPQRVADAYIAALEDAALAEGSGVPAVRGAD